MLRGSNPASAMRPSIDAVVPPGDGGGQPVELIQGQPQGLADIPQRALAPVADHRGGQRCALAAVTAIDILDDFLAPLVFEIHVDVRRFITLFGDETLEQHFHTARVHGGNAEAITHGGVGRRSAALAENVAAAGEGDDIVDGEEIGFVTQFGDDRELVFDLRPHPVRDAGRPAFRGTLLGEPAQISARCLAGRHHVIGIFVAQFIETEGAALGDADSLGEPLRFIQMGKPRAAAQIALAVGIERKTGFLDGNAVADGGEHILQHTPAAQMHVHIARRHQGQLGGPAQVAQMIDVPRIVRAAMQLQRDPCPAGKGCRQPPRIGQRFHRARCVRRDITVIHVGQIKRRRRESGNRCTIPGLRPSIRIRNGAYRARCARRVLPILDPFGNPQHQTPPYAVRQIAAR